MGSYRTKDLLLVPGLLSLARLPLAVLFASTLARPRVAFSVLLLAAFTDVLDGWYARAFGQQTATGAALDAVTDKLFVASAVAALVATSRMSLAEAALLGTREMGELPLAIRVAMSRDAADGGRGANGPGKLVTTLQFAAVTAVLFGSSHRTAFLRAAGVAGVISATSYWLRERASAAERRQRLHAQNAQRAGIARI